MALKTKACPVCRGVKEQPWHLACATCWAKLPLAQRREVHHLFKYKRDTDEHRDACRSALRTLIDQRNDIKLTLIDTP